MVFCVIEESVLEKKCTLYDLKYWFEDKRVGRIATTFATTEEDVMKLVNLIE